MWLRAFFFSLWAAAVAADPLRLAVYNVELDRDGPGLLLRDIEDGAEDVLAVAEVIAEAAPDVILLTRFDYDLGLEALSAFNARLGPRAYPHLFALRPNTGRATGLDLNRNGRTGEPEDAQGFGRFAGQNGMAILSRFPVDTGAVRDFSGLLWRDLPGARLPFEGDDPFWEPEVMAVLRLSSVAHWDVPVIVGDRRLHLLAFHGSPPVFDGPEDRNGLRGAEELRLWQVYLDGGLGPPPGPDFVVIGTANIDPGKGDGRREQMRVFLGDPRIRDPVPRGASGPDTVDWSGEAEPGNLRADYVLPSAALRVTGSAVVWPPPGTPEAGIAAKASRHRLVWVDLDL